MQDTLPRPGIIDALTTGCVPILFHPGQASLWPSHWTAHAASPPSAALFDLTDGVPRPRLRDREHARYATRAQAALTSLLDLPLERLEELRRGVATAASRVVYTRRSAEGTSGASSDTPAASEADAVDLLVESMRSLRLAPNAAETAAYEAQLRARRALIDAQAAFEGRGGRRAGGRAGARSAGRVRRGRGSG